MTLKLSLAAVCVGLLLGLLGAIAKTSKYAALRFLGTYTTIVRGVPETLWVLMIYFGTVSGLNALGDLFGKPDLALAVRRRHPGPRPVLRRLRHRGVPRRAVVLSARPSRGRPGARPVARTDLLAHRPAADLAGRPARPRQPVPDPAEGHRAGVADHPRRDHAQAQVASNATKEPFTFYMTAAAIYLSLTVVIMVALHFLERRAGRGFVRNEL